MLVSVVDVSSRSVFIALFIYTHAVHGTGAFWELLDEYGHGIALRAQF
jgi:succinate dehydrogenase hydrophobic anchor subunit